MASGDFPEVSPAITISKWRQLGSTDRQSLDFLRSLLALTAKSDRSHTTRLRGEGAKVVLDVMDKVVKDEEISDEYQHNTLKTMRELAYNSGQVPTNFQVDRRLLSKKADVIARGAFAEIREGRLNDKRVAIKTLRIGRKVGGKEPRQLFCKESVIWMNLSHPNILKLIGVDIESETSQYSMISEMMVNGNIREYIRENSVNRHNLLLDAAAGLSYLHKRGIVHGDFKGNNILITNGTPPRACLADFGLSTFTPGVGETSATNTSGGTLLYMAPELLYPTKFGNSSVRPTMPADIYAFGMVIYEVLTGSQPFYDRKWPLVEVSHHVTNGERPSKPDDAEGIGFGGGTWELVEECWRPTPHSRARVERIHEHLKNVAASSAAVAPTSKTRSENSSESSLTTQSSDSTPSEIRQEETSSTRTMETDHEDRIEFQDPADKHNDLRADAAGPLINAEDIHPDEDLYANAARISPLGPARMETAPNPLRIPGKKSKSLYFREKPQTRTRVGTRPLSLNVLGRLRPEVANSDMKHQNVSEQVSDPTVSQPASRPQKPHRSMLHRTFDRLTRKTRIGNPSSAPPSESGKPHRKFTSLVCESLGWLRDLKRPRKTHAANIPTQPAPQRPSSNVSMQPLRGKRDFKYRGLQRLLELAKAGGLKDLSAQSLWRKRDLGYQKLPPRLKSVMTGGLKGLNVRPKWQKRDFDHRRLLRVLKSVIAGGPKDVKLFIRVLFFVQIQAECK